MSNQNQEIVKNEKYYGLQLISFICKALTVLVAIIGIGLIGANTIRIFSLSPPQAGASLFQLWLRDGLLILLSVGTVGFLLFIISQIIDVQMAINAKLNAIASVVISLGNITESLEKIEPPKVDNTEHHKEVMESLKKQNRILLKLYRDTVGDPDALDDSIPIKLSN